MKKILIATTNPGKFKEITQEFSDLPFHFVSLVDLQLDQLQIDEPYETTWENALHKARFFAHKSKLLTIAEDTGLFVARLRGAPGVRAKRYGATALERNTQLLKELLGVPEHKRTAFFETHVCLYNPFDDQFSVFKGTCHGRIAVRMEGTSKKGMGYDSVFYHPPSQKLFSQMTIAEKNLISHRGAAINRLKHYLSRQFSAKQLVVALALIVRDRKILMLKRRDHRTDFNNKWEFPGGGVEFKETVEQCLVREARDETGFTVAIDERLPTIYTAGRGEKSGNYQVFLILYITHIQSGKLKTADTESSGHGWYSYNELVKLDALPLNKKIIQDNKKVLKQYID